MCRVQCEMVVVSNFNCKLRSVIMFAWNYIQVQCIHSKGVTYYHLLRIMQPFNMCTSNFFWKRISYMSTFTHDEWFVCQSLFPRQY